MTNEEQEALSLRSEFEGRETGVADMMEFYEKVEDIYLQASTSIPEGELIYTSDSTNPMRFDAYLGRDPS